ncbi:hypothetical protein E4U44_006140 [Claviceps purpurea]|nr:hypothetical protein E4U44_006140 [Claviceps purpurea]
MPHGDDFIAGAGKDFKRVISLFLDRVGPTSYLYLIPQAASWSAKLADFTSSHPPGDYHLCNQLAASPSSMIDRLTELILRGIDHLRLKTEIRIASGFAIAMWLS